MTHVCSCCGIRSGSMVPLSTYLKNRKGYICENPVECVRRADEAGMDKKIPDEWEEQFGIKILDPDGWRPPHEQALTTPLTQAEFLERMSMSTIKVLGRP